MQDVYAAVVKSASVKIFFALTAVRGLKCRQFDFTAVFLNSSTPPEKEYYV
jgi:hypothetical protein